MSKEKKSNVIQFPNRMLEIEKKLKESREAVQYISDEAADTAQYMLDIIESELQMSPNLISIEWILEMTVPESLEICTLL